ncbi:MAG TPA: hypothetical protein VMS75_09320 [Terriglobales bacterium]|nr:hypothetical protein [Terriglobales bacterium]
MGRKRILFICGSLNQTTINSEVARHLADYDCWFTPFYGNGIVWAAARAGLLEFSILGRRARGRAEAFLRDADGAIDDGGSSRDYDLVVTCTDLIIPKNVRTKALVLVQEGMIDPENLVYRLVRALHLPRFLANTSMTGLSRAYRAFCVASDGFREIFVRKGLDPGRIRVTGIPNFDNVDAYRVNEFPLRNFVLAATSHLRECLKFENRKEFILRAMRVADGRPLLFKLHPLECSFRAEREIRRYAPGHPVYTDGNTNHMIANSQALVTRYSSVVLVAAALGKEVHSDLDPRFLQRVKPIQNGGSSGRNIAEVCREFL